MAEEITRTRVCDQCGADLTVTDSAYGNHLMLVGQWTPSRAMISYSPHPELPETAHFCDRKCLTLWAAPVKEG